MGELWDKMTGAEAAERSKAILGEKYPATRGLSEETRVDVEEGVLVIADDDPQAEILKDMTGTGEE